MDQAKAGFVATISWRTEQRAVREDGDARAQFWRPIQQDTRSDDAENIEQLENNVVAGFPTILHRALMQHFQTLSVRFNERVDTHPRELHAVFFGVSIQGYGSALLAVDIGGAKDLAELFNGNIDTFTLLMEAFVPRAFANVVPSTHGTADFEASIAPTAELSRIFTQVQMSQADPAVPSRSVIRTPPEEEKEGATAKIPRALVATAFSLVTPVVLSLIVLYCAAQMLLQERAELSKREASLVADEQDLRKTEHTIAADLQKENLELLRLLRPSTPSPPPKQ